MASSTIPVDLRNPGQVFACLGLMEAAEILFGQPCEGGFNYRGLDVETTFTLCVEEVNDPIDTVVRFLARAEVKALAPRGSELSTAKWDVETLQSDRSVFPCPMPDSPAALPIILTDGARQILVDHWADGPATGRDNVKFWAGAAGYPGAALARDALAIVRELGDNAIADAVADPFNLSAP